MTKYTKLLSSVAAASILFSAQTAIADSQMNHSMHGMTMSPQGAQAYIISPKDGDTVSTTFTVKFGLKGMGVAPAGIEKASTGHHHLLIDGMMPNMMEPLGKNVKHFGGGQTETELTLSPGQHTLQLILGDHRHMPHNPAVTSEKITITVK